MSTILDALRKVEGERRASSPSPRQRLLFFSQMTLPAASWYRGVWMMGVVLVGMGFASGLGVALWRSGARVVSPAGQPVSVGSTLREQPSVPPAPLPSESAGAADATTRLSQRFASTPAPVGQVSSVGLPELSLADSLHNQPQDTLRPQTLSSLSSLDIPNQNDKLNSRYHPLPQPQPQRNPLKISLNLLQWSPEVEKRRAAIRVNSGPMLTVHEGKTVSDLTVERILPDAVELRFGNSTTVKLRLGDSILHGQTAR